MNCATRRYFKNYVTISTKFLARMSAERACTKHYLTPARHRIKW